MGWDEALFGYILKKISKRRSPARENAGAELETEAPTLRLLAAALTAEAIKILPAEDVGRLDGDRLFLPERIDLFAAHEDNRRVYLHRVIAACAARMAGLTLPAGSEGKSRELSLAVVPALRARIATEFPIAQEWLTELAAKLVPRFGASSDEVLRDPRILLAFFGELSLSPPSAMLPAPGPNESFAEESLASGTEKKGKARERAEEVRLNDKKDDENPLVHVFEKVLTADEYNGGKKSLDGSDELEDHAEALDELNLRHVIRSREKAHSIYKSDVMIDGGAPDLEETHAAAESFLYDEWDHSKKSYRRGWCTVSKSKAIASPAEDVAHPRPRSAAVKKLRSELEKRLNERRWRGRQTDGPEPDLDALVTASADRRSGIAPSNRLFMSRRRAQRDFAAIILIDMSLSTDSWVGGQHVIQVARESVVTLAEVLDGIADDVSVAAFSSNTRRDCRFVQLKGFDENWATLHSRIPALTPTGYTRIGPAIRHAAAELNRTGAKKKLLLLISDGKPTDYDRYEGTYGIEDVRQAIKEARGTGLRVHSLAIDAEAKFYLPRMFGEGRYQILPHPAALAPALSRIFARCLG